MLRTTLFFAFSVVLHLMLLLTHLPTTLYTNHSTNSVQGFGNIVVVEMVVAQPYGNTTQNIKKL
jgi:hypothetical protein